MSLPENELVPAIITESVLKYYLNCCDVSNKVPGVKPLGTLVKFLNNMHAEELERKGDKIDDTVLTNGVTLQKNYYKQAIDAQPVDEVASRVYYKCMYAYFILKRYEKCIQLGQEAVDKGWENEHIKKLLQLARNKRLCKIGII